MGNKNAQKSLSSSSGSDSGGAGEDGAVSSGGKTVGATVYKKQEIGLSIHDSFIAYGNLILVNHKNVVMMDAVGSAQVEGSDLKVFTKEGDLLLLTHCESELHAMECFTEVILALDTVRKNNEFWKIPRLVTERWTMPCRIDKFNQRIESGSNFLEIILEAEPWSVHYWDKGVQTDVFRDLDNMRRYNTFPLL